MSHVHLTGALDMTEGELLPPPCLPLQNPPDKGPVEVGPADVETLVFGPVGRRSAVQHLQKLKCTP